MREQMNKQQHILQLFAFSIAPMLIPMHNAENSFLKAAYVIAAYQWYRLWQMQPRCAAFGDKLMRAMLLLSSIICLTMLLPVLYPLWSFLFCLLLLGQIAALHIIERRCKLICEDCIPMLCVCRWILTGMNLLVCAAYICTSIVEHIGIQEPAAWYDIAVWTPMLMNVPRLIIGICVIVSLYQLCVDRCGEVSSISVDGVHLE